MTERISVALCTHNGARFIEAQLRSILAQSTPPDEIVLSDDASTDDTVDVAIALVGSIALPQLDFVVLRNPKALGVTANFESAIRATTGELIVLSDQDDLWYPDRLSRAIKEFDARPGLDFLFADARLVDAEGVDQGRNLFSVLEVSEQDLTALHRGDGFSVFIRRNIATGATSMFRRRLLEVALPFPTGWVHDEWLAVVAATVGQLDSLNAALIDYRQHASNQIGVDYPTFRRKVRRALEPRGGRNDRLATQFAQLAERLDSVQDRVLPERLAHARTKAAFEAIRQALPAQRRRRLWRVLAADRRGWYSEYASQGRLDMVRDLLQPHGE
ncbi:glycosyltransferase family 2 protein [Lacisediminihabitans changchengi]|uniref:Glycosyltransferase family 2 protein n=1 Tax=Lacisediminihabitans changchengi TaxID=2787634 RepID=A0A934W3F6_9MICO|nr:glycosyltransferase family 2 protein [Lacisediminihabitans changchengi]MBK4346454.1 glycosyltransferase family 2 protein [Lacisediminihabitans changchengi]MBK4348918.1 glycosyltransferase family 2 protein [Lacisediminihabitans changchengi]